MSLIKVKKHLLLRLCNGESHMFQRCLHLVSKRYWILEILFTLT